MYNEFLSIHILINRQMLNRSIYEHLHTLNRAISETVFTLEKIAGVDGMPRDQLAGIGDHFNQLQARTNALLAGVISERETERSAGLLQLRFRL
jgi:hypothetical protein